MKPALTTADYRAAAKSLNCDMPAIRAVDAVESQGAGFLANGRPKVLFEAHHFDRLTGGRYRRSHPHLSSARWNRALYSRTGAGEHKRLAEAVELDRDAALQSASWGRFQIMGFNYARAGFSKLQAFINSMHGSEAQHLLAFCAFVKSAGCDDELRAHDWAGFARVYNGPAYAENHYDTKLAAAYRSFVKAHGASRGEG